MNIIIKVRSGFGVHNARRHKLPPGSLLKEQISLSPFLPSRPITRVSLTKMKHAASRLMTQQDSCDSTLLVCTHCRGGHCKQATESLLSLRESDWTGLDSTRLCWCVRKRFGSKIAWASRKEGDMVGVCTRTNPYLNLQKKAYSIYCSVFLSHTASCPRYF
jgi:hypothetical protein